MRSSDDQGPGTFAALAGLGLAATSALPLVVGEKSPLVAFMDAFAHDWLNGLVTLLLFGTPYLLGAALAAAVLTRSALGVVLLRIPITILYIELVYFALILARDSGDLVAPWAFIGFVAVSTLSAVTRFVHDRRQQRPASVAWLGRWGAMLVAGAIGWGLLQVLVLGDASQLVGVWATFAAAVIVAGACRPRRDRSHSARR